MRLCEILSADRVFVDAGGVRLADKDSTLLELSTLIAPALHIDPREIHRLLVAREELQSTGIGDGVAIPHASTDAAPGQAAALLICPGGIEFSAIDQRPVSIIFGVVGPTRATGEHLRTLARISRLLRDSSTRQTLLSCADAETAYHFVVEQDGSA
jgi:nitrogen PTS system EIIA component